MIELLMLTTPAVLGAVATYFAPSKLKAKAIFVVSIAFTATGILVFFFSNHRMTQIELMRRRLFESGNPDWEGYTQYDWLGLWLDFSMAGVFLAIFGVGACLGSGLRKLCR